MSDEAPVVRYVVVRPGGGSHSLPTFLGIAAGPSTCQRGRRWFHYLRPQANLVFDRVGPTDLQRQARRVVRWLEANRRTEVTREDLRRHALCRALNAGRTDSVIAHLRSGGVLRPVVFEMPPHAGRPPQLYEVNPGLAVAK